MTKNEVERMRKAKENEVKQLQKNVISLIDALVSEVKETGFVFRSEPIQTLFYRCVDATKRRVLKLRCITNFLDGDVFFLDDKGLCAKVKHINASIEKLKRKRESYDNFASSLNRYIDSPKLAIEGTLVITDPCYVAKTKELNYDHEPFIPEKFLRYEEPEDYPDKRPVDYLSEEFDDIKYPNPFIATENGKCQFYFSQMYADDMAKAFAEQETYRKQHMDDWERSGYGSNMEALGITKYLATDTIYGDWSCTVFNSETKEEMGDFCADAGMVMVATMEEIQAYDPNFPELAKEHNWCVAVIPDFKGEVWYRVIPHHYKYKGKDYTDYAVGVEGDGVNTKTGGKIKFFTKQTGL